MARLQDSFGLVGHQCLVLERLRPSLLGLIAESVALDARAALAQLRAVTFQLLVRASHQLTLRLNNTRVRLAHGNRHQRSFERLALSDRGLPHRTTQRAWRLLH